MTYEIITSRWTCQECGAPLRLHFSQQGAVEEEQEPEYVCDQVLCASGHPVPEDVAQEATLNADQEFYAALEGGYQVGQIWQAPESQESSVPSELPPPEE